MTWAAALEPVGGVLVPELLKRYPASRRVVEGGNLEVPALVAEATGYDRSANLLARYATKPSDLAELAVLTDVGFAALEAAAPGHVEGVRSHLFDPLTPEQLAALRDISETLLAPLAAAREPNTSRRPSPGVDEFA